jgi:hypothetical protein
MHLSTARVCVRYRYGVHVALNSPALKRPPPKTFAIFSDQIHFLAQFACRRVYELVPPSVFLST